MERRLGSHLPVRILVRTDLDWRKMDAASFAAQKDPTQPLSFISLAVRTRALESFTDVFGFDFFLFRAELQAIAAASLRAVRDARVTVGFSDFDAWFDEPGDELIFAVDDDDIFHPDLASLASEVSPTTDLVVWNHAAYGHASSAVHPAVHRLDNALLMSNNWGVKKSFLRSHMSRTEARRFLSDHGVAQLRMVEAFGLPVDASQGSFARFTADLVVPPVRVIPGHFGLQFFHPAALSQIFYAAEFGVRSRYEELDLETTPGLPGGLAWAQPYVDRYIDLVARLAAARRRRVTRR